MNSNNEKSNIIFDINIGRKISMELLDVLDEDGNIIGVEDRKVVHEKGLWHIHVEA